MRPSEYDIALADFAVHNCSFSFTRVDMQIFGVARQNLDAAVLKRLCVDKHSTSIVVAHEVFRQLVLDLAEGTLMYLQVRSPRPCFRVIYKP